MWFLWAQVSSALIQPYRAASAGGKEINKQNEIKLGDLTEPTTHSRPANHLTYVHVLDKETDQSTEKLDPAPRLFSVTEEMRKRLREKRRKDVKRDGQRKRTVS